MSRRWIIGCWSLLLASAFYSTPSSACGWYGCDGYYRPSLGAPVAAYGYYAAPVYYVPPPVVYIPPPVTYVPLPVYQYGPPVASVYYGAPAAGAYYGYGGYGVRRTVVRTRYYGPRRTYVRSVHYAGPARRVVRRR